jgi:hypothetical protein
VARSSGPSRRRLARLEGFRSLTDPEAVALLDDPKITKVIASVVEWKVSRTSTRRRAAEVRTKVPVINSLGENLVIDGRIAVSCPWASHWQFTWGDKTREEHPTTIRRLDLRDDHVNPDGTVWDRQTHKHRWSVRDGNDWAYTPSDIPHGVDIDPDVPDDYREIFEAFAKEVGVGFTPDYAWTDPPRGDGWQDELWEVP